MIDHASLRRLLVVRLMVILLVERGRRAGVELVHGRKRLRLRGSGLLLLLLLWRRMRLYDVTVWVVLWLMSRLLVILLLLDRLLDVVVLRWQLLLNRLLLMNLLLLLTVMTASVGGELLVRVVAWDRLLQQLDDHLVGHAVVPDQALLAVLGDVCAAGTLPGRLRGHALRKRVFEVLVAEMLVEGVARREHHVAERTFDLQGLIRHGQ